MARGAADIIDAFNKGREPERLALKMAAMRSNVFSFYRGTAHLFWQRAAEKGFVATAPAAWCSGDLHLENFGTYVADNGLSYFDVNDFDEAAKAPCDWEVLRLMTSIAVAAPSMAVGKPEARALMKSAADAYRDALQQGNARWIERRLATGAIGELMGALRTRNRARLLARRTVVTKGRRRLDLDRGRMLPITRDERERLETFAAALGKKSDDPKSFAFLDGARRIAGTGSLGIARFVLLVEGDGSPDDNVLLDLKAASPSTLAAQVKSKQPHWGDEAVRVVDSQRRCQAVAPHLLDAVKFGGKPFVLKELQPSADRLDLGQIASRKKELSDVIATMGRLSAWAQLRSAGRAGSATVDELMRFADGDRKFSTRMIDAANDMAATTVVDYADFYRHFDAKAGEPPGKQPGKK